MRRIKELSEKESSVVYCGLCDVYITKSYWRKHQTSKKHNKNKSNDLKLDTYIHDMSLLYGIDFLVLYTIIKNYIEGNGR